MIRKQDLARFVVSLLPNAIEAKSSHRSLVAFSTGVIAEYINRNNKIDEGIIALLLPTCVKMVDAGDLAGAQDIAVSASISVIFTKSCY